MAERVSAVPIVRGSTGAPSVRAIAWPAVTRNAGDPSSDWRIFAIETLGVVAAVLTAVIYGVLTLAYSKFYAELAVRPADAGVTYGAGLAGAAGVTITILGISAVVLALVGVLLAGIRVTLRLLRRSLDERLTKVGLGRLAVVLGAAVALIFGIVYVVTFIEAADEWADRVKAGEPVEPITIFIGLRGVGADVEVLGVRADFARIEPVGDGDDSPRLQELVKRPLDTPELFYLGRSNAGVLLYDSQTQLSDQIPSDLVVVTVVNCETAGSRDPACIRLWESRD